MCTVIYSPQEDGILLCSVRDESPARKRALEPQSFNENDIRYLCPIDAEQNGTWVGTNENREAIILMNGAFTNHLPNSRTFRKSRGLIVRELIANGGILKSWELIDLLDIEPFTLVVFSEKTLRELVWDGTKKYERDYATNELHIWSSSTLYSASAKQERNRRFEAWLATDKLESKEDILRFLKSFQNTEIGFVMNRASLVQSLSISIMKVGEFSTAFDYLDLLAQTESQHILKHENS